MSIEELLHNTMSTLNSIHILGADSEAMERVKKNIRIAIAAIDRAKEEASYADRNEQGKDV